MTMGDKRRNLLKGSPLKVLSVHVESKPAWE